MGSYGILHRSFASEVTHIPRLEVPLDVQSHANDDGVLRCTCVHDWICDWPLGVLDPPFFVYHGNF